ncbi:MAG: hypothetical protein Q8P79_03110 [Nanoarchaeota archaeon]|nr:hypothetical protein [Nanoarchaeota archaeon]
MADSSLKDFVEAYIDTALEASKNGQLCMNDFDAYIFRKVSERTGLPEDAVRYLHHPFHWVLFLKKDSPLEVIQSSKANGSSRVQIKNPVEASSLISRILNEHGAMLEERFKKVTNK